MSSSDVTLTHREVDPERLLAFRQIVQADPEFWVSEPHPARPEARDHGYHHALRHDGVPNRQRLFVPILVKRFLAHREELLDLGNYVDPAVLTTARRPTRGRRLRRARGYRAWLGLPQRKRT